MLRAVGWGWRKLYHKKEKNKPHSWHQRSYVLTGPFSQRPPHPCQRFQLYLWLLLYEYLELSLLLEPNSSLIRSICSGAPSSTQSCVSYIPSHFIHIIALHGRNYCYVKLSNEKSKVQREKLCKLWKKLSLNCHGRLGLPNF